MKHLRKFNELNDFNWDDVLKDKTSESKWSELEKIKNKVDWEWKE